MFNTPVLFIIFNRPDRTQLVFNEIKKQKPKKLFVHADGARPGNQDDIQNCLDSRRIIDQQIDWECDIQKIYRTENLGCGRGPAEAITWFFNNVEEGIIIEDDCIPHQDFFKYCEELLEKYRNDERIMVIGATTYRDDYPCNYSYTFTIYATMAAWATWKRVWKQYDFNLLFLNRVELNQKLGEYLFSKFEVRKWMTLYDWMVKDGFSDYWDWQMQFLMFYKEGVAVRPQKNMIRNIGIGVDATHTISYSTEMFVSNRPIYGCLPLSHPPKVKIDKKLDARYFRIIFKRTFYQRIMQFILKVQNRLRKLFL
jgi:hypothetical protein